MVEEALNASSRVTLRIMNVKLVTKFVNTFFVCQKAFGHATLSMHKDSVSDSFCFYFCSYKFIDVLTFVKICSSG